MMASGACWRAVIAAVVAAGVVLAVGSDADARAVRAASGTPVVLTVTVTGNYSDSWHLTDGDVGSETVSWTATERDSFAYNAAGGFAMVAHGSTVGASGSQSATYPNAPSSNESCTVTGGVTGWTVGVSEHASGQEFPADYSVGIGPPDVYLSGQNCPTFRGPGAAYYFECEPEEGCVGSPTGTAQQKQAWQGAWDAAFSGPLTSLPVRQQFGGSLSSADDSTSISEDVNVCEGTVSVCNGTLQPSPPIPATPLTPEKKAAQKDFKAALDDARGPCLQLAAGLGVLATGAVWLSSSATVPGGIPSGGAIISTGEVMTAAAGYLCTPKIRRLLDDYRIFKDPPARPYTQLAAVAATPAAPRLHACAGLKATTIVFCVKLRALVEQLIGAARHTAAVDDALLATVDRASAAERARDKAALRRQLAHARQLRGQLAGALATEAAIGRQIKRLVPFGNLTLAQATTATGYVQRKLARSGISATEVTAIDPGAAPQTGEDPIRTLVHP